MIIQFCGLSGSGKTSLALRAKQYFDAQAAPLEVLDGDVYRSQLSPDLGFSEADRITNIRRLAFVASRLAAHNVIPIICAINPYESARQNVIAFYPNVQTVYIKCNITELTRRDTKGLYARAALPQTNPNKVMNLSGINDAFEEPKVVDLLIETDKESLDASAAKLIAFIKNCLASEAKNPTSENDTFYK